MSKQLPLHTHLAPSEPPIVIGQVIVSDEDFDRLHQFLWIRPCLGHGLNSPYRIDRTGSASRDVYLGREVLGLGSGIGDPRGAVYIDREPLDNTRENLRPMSRRQCQLWSRLAKVQGSGTKYMGVTQVSPSGFFVAVLRRRHLGMFFTPHEAAFAFNHAASFLPADL